MYSSAQIHLYEQYVYIFAVMLIIRNQLNKLNQCHKKHLLM